MGKKSTGSMDDWTHDRFSVRFLALVVAIELLAIVIALLAW